MSSSKEDPFVTTVLGRVEAPQRGSRRLDRDARRALGVLGLFTVGLLVWTFWPSAASTTDVAEGAAETDVDLVDVWGRLRIPKDTGPRSRASSGVDGASR